jgi:hypothetical protein
MPSAGKLSQVYSILNIFVGDRLSRPGGELGFFIISRSTTKSRLSRLKLLKEIEKMNQAMELMLQVFFPHELSRSSFI